MKYKIQILLFCILVPLQIFSQEIDTSAYIQGEPTYNLLIAAYRGYPSEVEKLLKAGADVNGSVQDGITALMYAVQNNHFEVIEVLTGHHADLDLQNDYGETALIMAVKNGNLDITEYLIRNNASVDNEDHDKVTPLMHSVAAGDFVMTDMLLYYGAGVSEKDKDGNNALMISSYLGLVDIDSLLLSYGADVNSTDNEGRTPLHAAVQNGYIDVVKLLIENGADVNATDRSGYSPLAVAIEFNDPEMTGYLVSKGARVNQKISMALSPLDIARSNSNDSIKQILKNSGARNNLLPAFEKILLGTGISMNADDFLFGIQSGFSDKKYNVDLTVDFKFRPFTTRVLEQNNDRTFYQYWERRALFSLAADKRLKIVTGTSGIFGLTAGIKEVFTFGSYKGTSIKPAPLYLFTPRAGIYYSTRGFRSKLMYEYMDLNLYEFQKGWIELSFTFLIDRKLNVYQVKNIDWY